jgi:hypothetical protein
LTKTRVVKHTTYIHVQLILATSNSDRVLLLIHKLTDGFGKDGLFSLAG